MKAAIQVLKENANSIWDALRKCEPTLTYIQLYKASTQLSAVGIDRFVMLELPYDDELEMIETKLNYDGDK